MLCISMVLLILRLYIDVTNIQYNYVCYYVNAIQTQTLTRGNRNYLIDFFFRVLLMYFFLFIILNHVECVVMLYAQHACLAAHEIILWS